MVDKTRLSDDVIEIAEKVCIQLGIPPKNRRVAIEGIVRTQWKAYLNGDRVAVQPQQPQMSALDALEQAMR